MSEQVNELNNKWLCPGLLKCVKKYSKYVVLCIFLNSLVSSPESKSTLLTCANQFGVALLGVCFKAMIPNDLPGIDWSHSSPEAALGCGCGEQGSIMIT